MPPSYLLLKSIGGANYGDPQGDTKLSTSSLNSNSSGSSSNSSESNSKNGLANGAPWDPKWPNSSENSLNVTSTPSESTSELSVLSSNTLVSPVNNAISNGNKKSLVIGKSVRPSSSTGAIPKSISFDVSAERGDRDLDDDARGRRSNFFLKLRMGFRSRRGKSFREDGGGARLDDERGGREPRSGGVACAEARSLSNAEASENILAKYRSKGGAAERGGAKAGAELQRAGLAENNNHVLLDGNSIYVDAKKKLRHVLSGSSTVYILPKQVSEDVFVCKICCVGFVCLMFCFAKHRLYFLKACILLEQIVRSCL